MKTILIIICLFCAGCSPAEYTGIIEIYDANNVLVRRVKAKTNKAAMIKDGDIEFDGRGISGWTEFFKGILQIATLGILAKD